MAAPNNNSEEPIFSLTERRVMQIADFIQSLKKDTPPGEPGQVSPVPATEPVPPGKPEDGTEIAPAGTLPQPKKPDATYRHYLRLLQGAKKTSIEEYDFERDGSLIDVRIPDGYEEVDQYWVERGRSLVIIAHNRHTNQKEYLLFEPSLSDFEYELLERLHEDLRDVLILSSEEIKKDRKRILLEKMHALLDDYGLELDVSTLFKLQYFLIRNFIGWSRIDPLMKDAMLEDISCDGNKIPLFLYHRKYRNIKTNIAFESEVLHSLAITLAQRSGKHISTGSPMVDATLPDGSRLQLTLGTEVTTRGTSFTIRKFREEPFSPVELMENGTFNAEALVYFWMAIENNKSLLFIGGTASGKTTSLNAVSLFIPPVAKVVSIEDTREITLYHDNWIASVTREALSEGGNAINMFDLLRAAMRQRPEFILVGEVRGVEAQTLFQAMNTGHTTFSTMHAGSVDAAIHRLESEPLNVPRNMMQALNIISVQGLIYHGTERVRRVQEVVEIAGIDPSSGNLRVNNVFVYDPVHDVFTYTGRSQIYADITEKRGWTREQLENEITLRISILNAMKKQSIMDYISVASLFHAYHIDAKSVLSNIDDLRKVL
jgi:archaeal flagellar protein FlaI